MKKGPFAIRAPFAILSEIIRRYFVVTAIEDIFFPYISVAEYDGI